MAYEPAIDIGDFTIGFSVGYVKSGGAVYTKALELDSESVDFSIGYVKSGGAVYTKALELDSEEVEFSSRYVAAPGLVGGAGQVYSGTDIIFMSSIPQEPGDDATLLVYGIFAEWTYLINGGRVSFFDQSLGSPVNWYWDLGDGSTSTEQNPIHDYYTKGPYTVSLTATFINGNIDTSTKIIYIANDGILFPVMGPF